MSAGVRSLRLLPLLDGRGGGSLECRKTSSRPTAAVRRRERVMGVVAWGRWTWPRRGWNNGVSRWCLRVGGGWQEKGGMEDAASPAPPLILSFLLGGTDGHPKSRLGKQALGG